MNWIRHDAHSNAYSCVAFSIHINFNMNVLFLLSNKINFLLVKKPHGTHFSFGHRPLLVKQKSVVFSFFLVFGISFIFGLFRWISMQIIVIPYTNESVCSLFCYFIYLKFKRFDGEKYYMYQSSSVNLKFHEKC